MLQFIIKNTKWYYPVLVAVSICAVQLLLRMYNPFSALYSQIPLVIILVMSYDIRASLSDNNNIGIFKYIVALIVCSVLVGISLIPVGILMLILQTSTMNLQTVNNSTMKIPWYTLLINMIIAIPIQIYSIGCYVQGLSTLNGTFSIKKSITMFKNQYALSTLNCIRHGLMNTQNHCRIYGFLGSGM